jgi:transcriptional regulator with XRE-family HTH domain
VEERHDVLIQFGARVRAIRQSKSLSQEAFASICGLDRTYISGIERGVRNVSLLNLHVLAKALDLSLSELMSEA